MSGEDVLLVWSFPLIVVGHASELTTKYAPLTLIRKVAHSNFCRPSFRFEVFPLDSGRLSMYIFPGLQGVPPF